MYQFSLDAYIDLFNTSIKKSQKSPKLEERLNKLNDFHTYAVYKSVKNKSFSTESVHYSSCLDILVVVFSNPINYFFHFKCVSKFLKLLKKSIWMNINFFSVVELYVFSLSSSFSFYISSSRFSIVNLKWIIPIHNG